MFLFFEAFRPQTVLILFLFSMELSYPLTAKFTAGINNSPETLYLNGTSNYITKDNFDGVSGHYFVSNFLKTNINHRCFNFLFLDFPTSKCS